MLDPGPLLGHWGYLAISLIVILGNVGVPVPEETTLILAGYLAWQGEFNVRRSGTRLHVAREEAAPVGELLDLRDGAILASSSCRT